MKSIRFYFMFLVYVIVMGIYYMQSQNALVHSTQQKIEHTLVNHQALRKIIRTDYIPELKRLKKEGLLHQDYNDPIFTSGTFLTQRLHDYTIPIQLKSAPEATRFKYASLNPINLKNRASKYEEDVLKKLIDTNAKKFSEIITEDSRRHLFYASFFTKMEKRCIQCHGDPKNAPEAQIRDYGAEHGYNYKEGDVSSLITIRSPLEESFTKLNREFMFMAIIVFVIFSFLYGLSEWAILRLEKQKEKITKTKEVRDKLLVEINKDPMTGLLNRRGFEERLEEEVNRAKRDDNSLVFFFFDIDYFKQYNDTYGHVQGDVALKAVAEVLLRNFKRANESVFRLGGEEFGVISSTKNSPETVQWAKQILHIIENMNIQHEKSPFKRVTVSLGIYILSPDNDDIQIRDIVKYADEALYEAKENGRNQAMVYKEDRCSLGFKERLSKKDS